MFNSPSAPLTLPKKLFQNPLFDPPNPPTSLSASTPLKLYMSNNFVDFNHYPPFGILKMGPIIPSLVGDMQPADVIYPMAILGQFKDYKNFSAAEIQSWVNSYWFTNEEIRVEKLGKTFFFYCKDIDDRDNLLSMKNACFHGALLVFKCWFPSAALRSFNFSICSLWIRVEGIPLTSNRVHVAERALKKIGRVICFDEASHREGPKISFEQESKLI